MRHIEAPFICKGFVICVGHITPNDVYDFTEKDTTADGVFSQIGFCIDGGAVLYDKDGNKVKDLYGDTYYDFKEFYGTEYKMVTGENGGTWFGINPVPATKIYNGEVIRPGQIKTIIGEDKEQVVICIYGKIEVNGKELIGKQYARIFKDKSARVVVNEGGLALYFYDSGTNQND
jgi:hypothetical protein